MSVTPHIQCTDVSFKYRENTILEHITFTVNPGDYVGVLGPNGGGKTTLLKLLLGLLQPTTGEIRLFGQKSGSKKALAHIGYVPQWASKEDWQFPATVEEIVRTGRIARKGVFHGFTRTDQKAIDEALERVGMSEYKYRLINQLSGGQRQRVFIARALAAQPKILMLDEPTVGVDIVHQESFYGLIRQLHKDLQMTIILVSHDIDVISQEVESVLCLNRDLVCHVSSTDFITKEHFLKLYGDKGKYILHRH